MSEDVDNAHEVDSLIIGTEPNRIGIFVGGLLPHVAVPDAPANSLYLRTTGELFRKQGAGPAPEDWEEDLANTGTFGTDLLLPFCLTSGAINNIPVIAGELPFFLSNGSQNNIPLEVA